MIKNNLIPNQYLLFVNGRASSAFGAIIENYTVSGTPVENFLYQGKHRTTFTELSQQLGMKTITVSLFFTAKTRRELAENKSALDGLLAAGKIELHLPDGFYYTSVCTSLGELHQLGIEGNEMIALCAYTFTGVQHDELKLITGNTLMVRGTMPQIDCRLSCTATAARSSLTLGTVTFTGIEAGDQVVADGMTGELSVNGQQVTATFTRLPYVVPGLQTFDCPEVLTVEYYPTWV